MCRSGCTACPAPTTVTAAACRSPAACRRRSGARTAGGAGRVLAAAAAQRRRAAERQRQWRHQPRPAQHARQGARHARVRHLPRPPLHPPPLRLSRSRASSDGARFLAPGARFFSCSHQAVDEVRLFKDSKTIVDMPLVAPPGEVAAAFAALTLPADPAARNDTLRRFVEQARGEGGPPNGRPAAWMGGSDAGPDEGGCGGSRPLARQPPPPGTRA